MSFFFTFNIFNINKTTFKNVSFLICVKIAQFGTPQANTFHFVVTNLSASPITTNNMWVFKQDYL